jgi:hypothetical protein
VVDLFAGLSLIWIGACWLWFDAIAPFAPLLPGALAPILLPLRQRLVASRAGCVRWTAPRLDSGVLRSVRIGRAVRVLPADLEAYLADPARER